MENEIGTFTSKFVNPFAMTVEDISIKDIAHSLALTCRFRGHTKQYYSVAEHCIRCAEMDLHSPDGYGLARYRLLHDAPEAYLCDLPSPLKVEYPFNLLKYAEEQILDVMYGKFQIPTMTEKTVAAVKHADLTMLATEVRDLCTFRLDRDDLPDPLPETIMPWTWQHAERRYLEVAHELLLCDSGVINGIKE